ncbi:MAG: hypothetical protein V1914_01350 [archaeon]
MIMTSHGSYEKHEELKRQLVLNPTMLGLEDIVYCREEVPYKAGKKSGQVDIIFWDSHGMPYLVELTTSTTDKAKRRVRKQIKRAKTYFKHAMGISVILDEDELHLEWI